MRCRTAMVIIALTVVLTDGLAMGVPGHSKDEPLGPKEEQILASVEAVKGFRPPALLLMAGREGTLPAFMSYGTGLFEGGPLGEKEAYLVALAAAVALKSPVCMKAHSESAIRAGASPDEIRQTALIAGMISGTSPLHEAFQSIEVLSQE
jgi:AhpD family alkylhydroperoxidase